MEKPKRDLVTPEMRARLMANRNGKLAVEQWIAVSTDPLITLFVLLMPVFIVLAPRLLPLLLRGGWIVLLGLLIAPVVLRARHYARVPVRYAVLSAAVDRHGAWAFWKPYSFYTDGGEQLVFRRLLAPAPMLERDRRYLVYYLNDQNRLVLLSISPEDHKDAELWHPTKTFHWRLEQRRQRR